MSLKEELDDWYVAIKHVDNGEDLYNFVNEYKNVVAKHWPKNGRDPLNWKIELDKTIAELAAKSHIDSIGTDSELQSHHQDATDLVFALNQIMLDAKEE